VQLLTESLKVTFIILHCSLQLPNFIKSLSTLHMQVFLLSLSSRLEIGQRALKVIREECKPTHKRTDRPTQYLAIFLLGSGWNADTSEQLRRKLQI